MHRAKVKLIYKQVIDQSSESSFERAIFQASYNEFLLKSQTYNIESKFKTFSKIKANDGRANSLHYKLSFAVGHFIAQLNNKIPVIKDNLGNKLNYETAAFELIESHIEDMSLHKIAINYKTAELLLVKSIGDYLLLAYENLPYNEPLNTFMLKIQPDISITSYQAVAVSKLFENNRSIVY